MNKKVVIILSILFCVVSSLFAQDKGINAKIYDIDNKPISQATVILQSADSTFIDATITDSLGVFRFDNMPPQYKLIIQHLLYETKEIDSKTNDLGIIHLSEKEYNIDQVVITAKRPLVKVVNGILTYDIEQITQNTAVSNAYEALLRLPGVAEIDGNISLIGAGGITIILDGKPSTMSSNQLIALLKQMPVSYVESAEVMYSTPPQYHVRGAAINLTTNKLRGKSENPIIQGEFNGAYTQSYYANYSTGTSLLYSSGKLSADFLYVFSDEKGRSGTDFFSRHKLNDVVYEINQYDRGKNESNSHRGRIGLDYTPDNKNKISFVYNTSLLTNGKAERHSTGNFSESNSINTFKQQLHNLSLDYSSNFGLKVGANYTYFKNPSTQDFIDNSSNVMTEFVSDSQQEIHNIMLYADQQHNLKNDWQLTYGAKFCYAKDHDYQIYNTTQASVSLPNTDNIIEEYIYNLYVGVGKQFSEKFSLNVSLTGEYYELADDHEWTLFPQTQISYIPSSKHIFQMSISSEKRYPSYWEKQDYRAFLNGYSEVQGNPELKPFNRYNSQLIYINNRKYLVILYHIYQPNYSAQLAYQATNRLSLIYKTLNWDYNQRAGLNVVLPFTVGSWLSSRVTLDGCYAKAKSENFHDISFVNDKFYGYIAINNTFNVSSKPDIKLDISAYYRTKPLQGIYDLSSIYNVNAGAKWTFANKKAELKLNATDIFDSSTHDISVRQSGQNYDWFVISDKRAVQLSFVYKFGGYKAKERKAVDRSRFGH